MYACHIHICMCVYTVWLTVHHVPSSPHTCYSSLTKSCLPRLSLHLHTAALLTDAMSVSMYSGCECVIFYGLSLLITLHSTVGILGRMRVGSVVGMLQRSIRKLLIITVITAAHWAAIRERWVANKYAPNIHICSCCCCFERWFMSVFI